MNVVLDRRFLLVRFCSDLSMLSPKPIFIDERFRFGKESTGDVKGLHLLHRSLSLRTGVRFKGRGLV